MPSSVHPEIPARDDLTNCDARLGGFVEKRPLDRPEIPATRGRGAEYPPFYLCRHRRLSDALWDQPSRTPLLCSSSGSGQGRTEDFDSDVMKKHLGFNHNSLAGDTIVRCMRLLLRLPLAPSRYPPRLTEPQRTPSLCFLVRDRRASQNRRGPGVTSPHWCFPVGVSCPPFSHHHTFCMAASLTATA